MSDLYKFPKRSTVELTGESIIWFSVRRSLVLTLIIIGFLLSGNSAHAISLAGSKTARILPQEDVRRFLGYGPTNGKYVDSERKIDLEGEALELTLWHPRGSWNFTQSVGLSYYQMDGSQSFPATAETVTIDYNRLTLNFSLGYAFDFGFVDVHPQYMLGFGNGNFGFTKEGNGVEVVGVTHSTRRYFHIQGDRMYVAHHQEDDKLEIESEHYWVRQ